MSVPRTAEIIAIGSELLLGGRQDTNSLMLTEALSSLGIEVCFKTVVGDRRADIARAIRVAAGRASVVVMTGGLGPTLDDRTREAVADVTKQPLRRHPQAVRQLTAWLHSRGRQPNEKQQLQALIPRGATVLRNSVGSAPGFLVTWKHTMIVAMPGVPAEAKAMCEETVLPRLRRQRSGVPSIVRLTLLTYGLPESELEERIVDLVPTEPGVELGTLASPLGVTVSLTAVPPRGRAQVRSPVRVLERSMAAMRQRLGALVYGAGSDTMEGVVGQMLRAHRATLATAESCTGGLIGHRLTQVPGSSAYYSGGAVCYSNEVKVTWLGVDRSVLSRHGAVSAEVAGAMADGIRTRAGSTVGLSVTGIAGPGGATASKPVGLVYVGLSMTGRPTITKEFRFQGPRDAIKLRASQAALNLVRLAFVPSTEKA